MRQEFPDPDTMRAALALAVRAPSIHNSQPWRWRLGDRAIHLFADGSRQLAATDPEGRDLVLSCGATLHHLRVALAAAGWGTVVRRLPNPATPDHLAAVEVVPAAESPEDVALAAAITRRRTDRRRFSSWPVPRTILDLLGERAAEQGALLVPALDPEVRYRLARIIARASAEQEADPAYTDELVAWAGVGSAAVEGVPAANIPLDPGYYRDTTMRDFPHGEISQPAGWQDEDGAELAVVSTPTDDLVSRLQAGEALSAVLLTATDAGLATCPISQPVEIGETLRALHGEVLAEVTYPQLVLRIGWKPISFPDLPPTPRRAVKDVLDTGWVRPLNLIGRPHWVAGRR